MYPREFSSFPQVIKLSFSIQFLLTIRWYQRGRTPGPHVIEHVRRIALAFGVDRVHQQLVDPSRFQTVQLEVWLVLRDPVQRR